MAETKETVVLEFEVDQGSAISELEKTKKSIIQLKQEQKELNDAYKKGNVTIEEYASESVRLEGILKKQQSTYNNVQKSVTGVKTKMDDLIASNNKLASSVKDSTANIRVAGVSMGDLSGKLAMFANPATAAVGIVTALGAAYARSSIGAKDLEFAQNQLNFVLDVATDKFASLFSSAEDGEGILTKFLNAYLKVGYYTPVGQALRLFGLDLKDIANETKEAAQAVEELNNIKEQSGLVQADINELTSKNADLTVDLANAELSILKRREVGQNILDNIKTITDKRLEQVNKEITAEEKLLKIRADAGGDTGDIELRINNLKAQRTSITNDESRQNARIEKQLQSINNAERKRLDTKKEEIKLTEEQERNARIAKLDRELAGPGKLGGVDDPFGIEANAKQEVRIAANAMDKINDIEKRKREHIKETSEFEKEQLQDRLDFTTTFLSQASSLFEENTVAYKLLALADAITNTYKGANLALGSYLPPASFALAGVTIATGLANVARISSTGFASGGYTGQGHKYQPKGVVHAGEWVAPKEMVESPKYRGTILNLERSRLKGYADGGVVASDVSNQFNQTLALANALKSMPSPVVSAVEMTKVQQRVKVKQSISSL